MGQVLHGSAKTTHAIRAELQRSQASVASLARKFGINEKTVLKWQHRQSEDMPRGPKERHSTVLSPMEEAAIVALRVQARLPLDDVYIAKDVIPHLTRSSLHRCLQRHGISRLPKADRSQRSSRTTRSATSTSTLPSYAMKAARASCMSPWTALSKLVFARIYRRATKLIAAGFLKTLIRWVPYRIHTILTDNGVQFVQRERGAKGLTFPHIFGRVCRENGIEHKLTKALLSLSKDPIIRGPTARPNAWCAPSRTRPSNPSTTHRSTNCAAMSAIG